MWTRPACKASGPRLAKAEKGNAGTLDRATVLSVRGDHPLFAVGAKTTRNITDTLPFPVSHMHNPVPDFNSEFPSLYVSFESIVSALIPTSPQPTSATQDESSIDLSNLHLTHCHRARHPIPKRQTHLKSQDAMSMLLENFHPHCVSQVLFHMLGGQTILNYGG